MELRVCRASGLKLSVLGLGCWEFGGGAYWGESDQKNVTDIVHKAVDLGINYFDSAELYNEGRSEEFLGKALKGIARDKVVVGSKIWPTNMHPQALREHCEASLRRLDLDYLDLYMIHWPLTPRTYPMFADTANTGAGGDLSDSVDMPALDGAVACLLQLQQEGKIRYLGLSNYGVELMKEIRAFGADFAANEVVYNLLTRAAETEVLPYCEQVGVGVIAYMVLMQGLLTDRYASLEDIPDWYTRTRHFDSRRNPKNRHGESGFETELTQVLQELRAIAREYGYSSADLALKWTVAAKGITCALIGTQNLQRLEHNALAIQEKLPAEILERLNLISQSLKEKLGSSMDVFESVENDRTR